MILILITVFALGYAAIIFEHQLKINKTATALLTGVLCWTALAMNSSDPTALSGQLSHSLGGIAEILFFLLGAMTIVELVDAHQGFKVITNRIQTRNTRNLLWVMSIITFFMSALLDNLTTAIVMISLLRKLVHDSDERKFFAGLIIIAANAGGAWSPIGDVTTTMLWIAGRITTPDIVTSVFVPSVICLLVPLLIVSFRVRGVVARAAYNHSVAEKMEQIKGSKRMLGVGLGGLVLVPVFKMVTHLPPYMGMLLSLSVVWVTSELIHIDKDEEEKKPYSAVHALTKIDTSSVLFFLGILMAISALESAHILENLARLMDESIGNLNAIVFAIGIASAVVDNVPLVAAAMGMYSPDQYPVGHILWNFLAYCAGTGGSILIIGSAAGVAVMGMEKIDFGWYVRRISFLALLGYLAGAAAFLIQAQLIGSG